MMNKNFITNINWPLIFVTLFLASVGLMNLHSASSSFDTQPLTQPNYFKAQLVWTLIGVCLAIVAMTFHYRTYDSMGYWIYGITMSLLVLVLVIGKSIAGHQSWLILGPIRLQPTEIGKLGLIFALARHLSSLRPGVSLGFKALLPSLAFFLIPSVLVILQGDLGSSLFYGLIYVSLVFIHGIRWHVIIIMGLLTLSLMVVAFFFFLSPYQKDRIATFMHPEMDRRGAGYHLMQSKIAVGSGGWVGKGYMKGQTHRLKFIPERHTDFIFPVLAEEWGFVGSSLVICSFLIFLFLNLNIANRAPDRFAFYLVIGVGTLFFWHIVVNLGGVLGLMPLTGVPLPFLSYGGSALMVQWLGVGFMLNVAMRRFMFT